MLIFCAFELEEEKALTIYIPLPKWLTLIFWGLSEKFINSEKEKLSISNTS